MFCSQTETDVHLLVKYPQLAALFDLLKKWSKALGGGVFSQCVCGLGYLFRKKECSYYEELWGVGSVQPMPELKGRVFVI